MWQLVKKVIKDAKMKHLKIKMQIEKINFDRTKLHWDIVLYKYTQLF